jgi:tetratricopeptide (TPR) repeat protein
LDGSSNSEIRSLRLGRPIARILLIIAALAFCAPSYGQFGQGAIYGKVLSREGKPLQGAVVRIQHLTTRQTDEAKTNRNGEYSISGLFQGQYKVTVLVNGNAAMVKGEAAGDAIYVASGLDVSVNFDLRTAPATLPATSAPTAPVAATRSNDGDRSKGEPGNAETEMRAAFSAGMAALKANNYEDAIKQFRTAAAKDPSQPGIFQNLGLALGHVKKFDESAAAFRRAIELKPDDAGLYAELSSALADAGKLDEATAPLQEAAKLNPSVGAQGYYNLGVVLTNRGRSKEAVDAFSKAIALDPNYAKPYYQLGIAYFGAANTLPQAISALERFLQFSPTGPDSETAKQLIEAAKTQLKK